MGSVVRVWDTATKTSEDEVDKFTGKAEIEAMFTDLFAALPNTTDIQAPLVAQEDTEIKGVLLVWSSPLNGYQLATDTFWFDSNLRIKRQNILVTTGSQVQVVV